MGGMGGYSASGGDATSGNGDVGFDSNSKFGGLNYKTGVNPLLIAAAVVGLLLLVKK